TYGIYENVNDIDFKEIPNEFVIKSTDGGGGHNVIICDSYSTFNKENKIPIIDSWLKKNTRKSPGREWVYDESGSKIIIEKNIKPKDNKGLIDYKFLCFNGEPEYLFIMTERSSSMGLNIGIFDMNFKHLPVKRKNVNNLNEDFPKPKNFSKMVEIARVLSSNFPHVRVDLYNVEGKIYFGELTFFHGSGYIEFEPDEFDYTLGKKFKIGRAHV